MVLFKLEIPIPRPILGVEQNEPLEVFGSVQPQKALFCAKPRRLAYRSLKLVAAIFLGAVTRNEQNKRK
jgi:hypothetical protein